LKKKRWKDASISWPNLFYDIFLSLNSYWIYKIHDYLYIRKCLYYNCLTLYMIDTWYIMKHRLSIVGKFCIQVVTIPRSSISFFSSDWPGCEWKNVSSTKTMAKLYFHTNNLESYKNAEFAGYLNKLQVDSVFRRPYFCMIRSYFSNKPAKLRFFFHYCHQIVFEFRFFHLFFLSNKLNPPARYKQTACKISLWTCEED